MSKDLTIGILAHVDAGKTTLSELLLYKTGSIRKLGRVDHKDAFLDNFDLEKDRGITIYSKQARFDLGDKKVTLLDTPGHVDFSSEMERTLQVLDYAVLLVSGADGVQGHSATLWKLLEKSHIPTLIFVNKMDQPGAEKELLLAELKNRFSDECLDFSSDADWYELCDSVATADEELLDSFLEKDTLSKEELIRPIKTRKVFPVFFGSALKDEGVEWFLKQLEIYMETGNYREDFGARVFKITRDEQGNRLTHLKVTGGNLKVKETVSGKNIHGEYADKINQIRLYQGKQYEMVNEVSSGVVCAVTGLASSRSGDGLGVETTGKSPVLKPVLSYRLVLPKEVNLNEMLMNLRKLEEEEPHLSVTYKEELQEIYVQVMGEIEIEILKSVILDRYKVEVSFDQGNLVYKETLLEPVLGVGHFEPLRHYAEVQLLMEPGPIGSGMAFNTLCKTDVLPKNWQQLVLTHLAEKEHIGVLTGSNLTDVVISLVAGRAHLKHTEGGDFREATFRAVRQGLMSGSNRLLEPVYNFRLEVPLDNLGRAMSDIIRLKGRHEDPEINGDYALITGIAPVATMLHYGMEVNTYSKGNGKLNLEVAGYEPCHNEEEVIKQIAYEPEKDEQNISGSVFCSKGSGYYVPWDQVDSHKHVDFKLSMSNNHSNSTEIAAREKKNTINHITEDEVNQIFLKTFGPEKEKSKVTTKVLVGDDRIDDESYSREAFEKKTKRKVTQDKYLLVDGYNIVYSWDNLKDVAKENMDNARTKLIELLNNYDSQQDAKIIVVFDAYQVEGGIGSSYIDGNVHVIFTKEAETADQYIERLVHRIRPKYDVTVATSDKVEQVIIMGKGARRLSAQGFYEEVMHITQKIHEDFIEPAKKVSNQIPIDKNKFQ